MEQDLSGIQCKMASIYTACENHNRSDDQVGTKRGQGGRGETTAQPRVLKAVTLWWEKPLRGLTAWGLGVTPSAQRHTHIHSPQWQCSLTMSWALQQYNKAIRLICWPVGTSFGNHLVLCIPPRSARSYTQVLKLVCRCCSVWIRPMCSCMRTSR